MSGDAGKDGQPGKDGEFAFDNKNLIILMGFKKGRRLQITNIWVFVIFRNIWGHTNIWIFIQITCIQLNQKTVKIIFFKF